MTRALTASHGRNSDMVDAIPSLSRETPHGTPMNGIGSEEWGFSGPSVWVARCLVSVRLETRRAGLGRRDSAEEIEAELELFHRMSAGHNHGRIGGSDKRCRCLNASWRVFRRAARVSILKSNN